MPRQTAARFLPVALLLLVLPAAAQDDECSMEASVRAEPVYRVPADAPVFAPLRWTMTRDQIRRALTADGWRRDASRTQTNSEWFDGALFGHDATLAAIRNSAGRLARVAVFVQDEQEFTWDRSLWNQVTGVLRDGYGNPISSTDTPSSRYNATTYCSSFGEDGDQRVSSDWDTLFARMFTECEVIVFYDGPGWPQHVQSQKIAEARDADRTCRADIARERRDRDRLAPGTSRPRGNPTRDDASTLERLGSRPRLGVIAGTGPVASAGAAPPPPPPPPPPTDVLDFSEVPPEMVGGLAALQQSVQYPDFEKRAGLEGTVVVRFIVTPEGRAEDVTVTRGVSPGLDAAAIAAVQRMRYTPGRHNGQPVRVRMTAPVRFTIR